MTNTPHDQLTELEPLLKELGIWPSYIHKEGVLWYYENVLNPADDVPINPDDLLAIVTTRAEKELCGRGWYPSYTWGRYYPPLSLKVEGQGGPSHSLTDALGVEIERQQK